ncbi:MAG: S-layer homology domain-containing protein, partial [Clostridiales bacterium]|nr:S-layer homology domain-containing protein [Clostridiales bacterium]
LEDEVADGYYIFNPATSAAAGTTVPLLITEVLTEQIYKIYFDKKKVPVLIRRVDEDGLKIAGDITAYYDDEENWLRAGEKAVVTTEPAAGYTLTEGYSKTVYADPNSTLLATQIVTFIYKEIEPAQATTVRIRMVNAADADIIPGFDVPATVGSSLTYNAPILPGYYLTGPEAGTANPVLPDGESEIIFTYAPLILLEISVYIVKDEGAPQLIELREVSAGTDAIVAVPYLPGYILKEYQEDNGPVEPAGDITHVGFSNISASHEVTFYYQNMENFVEDEFFNILVQGIDEDTGIDLYNHVLMVRRSDTETIEVSAFDVIGYELLSPSLLIVPADGSETNLVFTYGSTEIDVTVKAELKNKTPVPEFDEIYLPAHLGQPLTACAPYIPGYELADDLIKSIAAVSADNRTISFEYKKTEGNLLILLKEDNTNGRVIMACPDTIPLAEDREYKIEDYDLSPYFFAAIDPAQSYTVTGGELPSAIEFYYKKQMRKVEAKLYNTTAGGDDLFKTIDLGGFPIGEVARINAPHAEGYKPLNNDPAYCLITDGAGSQPVRFDYMEPETDQVMINAVNKYTEEILFSYTLAGAIGAAITVNAPDLTGWKLADGEKAVLSQRVPGAITFRYVEDTVVNVSGITVLYLNRSNNNAKLKEEILQGNYFVGQEFKPNVPGSFTQGGRKYKLENSITAVTLKAGDNLIEVYYLDDGPESGKTGASQGTTAPSASIEQTSPTGDAGNEPVSGSRIKEILETDAHIPYITGYPDKTVRPDATMTRADVAMIFWRLLRTPEKNDAVANSFSDIKNGIWYSQAVNYLAKTGFLQGYPDGSFKPDQMITRAEFTAITARFDDLLTGISASFSDVPESHWAYQQINSAFSKGWLTGYEGGIFRPSAFISRGEAVTIVNRMLERIIDKDDIPSDFYSLYTDLPAAHWAFPAIIEASVAHEYEWKDEGSEIWK